MSDGMDPDDLNLKEFAQRLERIACATGDMRKALEDLCNACALLPATELERMRPQLDQARLILLGNWPRRRFTGGRS